jgi:hypothetical protein
LALDTVVCELFAVRVDPFDCPALAFIVGTFGLVAFIVEPFGAVILAVAPLDAPPLGA